MMESREEEYSIYNVARLMKEEEFGMHISLIDNGKEKKTVLLNHPWQGLIIVPGVWRVLEDFSSGAVCMVLASDFYNEDDYIYEYDEFLEYANE